MRALSDARERVGRRSIYIGLALALVATPALAGVKAGPNVIGRHHRLGPGGGGVLAGAGLDYNFMTGQYFQSGATPGVTVARASSKSCDDQAGNWTTVANNLLCATNKGALIEETRTNSIRNNSMQGAVVGTPGTLPTNWSIGGAVGLTTSVIGVGTAFGIDYIDIRFSGTAGGTFGTLFFEASGTIAAANGQAWALVPFVAVVGGSLTNVTLVSNVIRVQDAGSATLSDNTGTNFSGALTSTLRRLGEEDLTIVNATAAFVRPFLNFNFTNGAAVDFTVRIGWPQLEQGAFATSPIRTTSAAITRAADVVNVTTPPAFGAAYTMFAQGTPVAPVGYATNQMIAAVSDNSVNNRFRMGRASAGGSDFNDIAVAGVAQASPASSGVWSAFASGKIVMAGQTGDAAKAFNGVLATASPASLPSGGTITTVNLGINVGGSNLLWNGYLERIALWPTSRLPNATLQSLTAP